MNILKLLDYLQSLEEQIGNLYKRYSELYTDDLEAVTFFNRMYREEKGHYNMVQFETSLARKNKGSFADVDIDEKEVQELLTRTENLQVAPPPSLEEALKNAIAIENSAAEAHFRLAIIESNPQIKNLIDSLGKADKNHFENLIKFVEQRGLFPRGKKL